MKIVQQQDPCGCGAATAAMIIGLTYEEAKAELDTSPCRTHKVDWQAGGISHVDMDWILGNHGYYGRIIYVSWHCERQADGSWKQRPDKRWPPAPFAPVHYAQVRQPSGNAHFVAMEADGQVLDPFDGAVKRLDAWPEVHHVVGLVKP